MNDNDVVDYMIKQVENIEKNILVEKYSSEDKQKKNAVERIYKELKETVNEDKANKI